MKPFTLVCLILVIAGCKSQVGVSLSSCALNDTYQVEYLGHAFGKGSIHFKQDDENPNDIAYRVAVYAPGSNEPNIAIKGIAQCQAGVVSGNFGSGTSSKAELSVLGGRFEGIFNNPAIEAPFGRWQVALYDAGKEKHYNLAGYWQNKNQQNVAKR